MGPAACSILCKDAMLIYSEAGFEKSLEYIRRSKLIAIDTETYWTNDWQQKRIIGVSIYCEFPGDNGLNQVFNAYYPFRHGIDATTASPRNFPLDYLHRLAEACNHDGATHLFHNRKFDHNTFRRDNIELTRPFKDTMLITHMIDENTSHVLEDLAEAYRLDMGATARKKEMHKLRKNTAWHCIDLTKMAEYACRDTANTYKLFEITWPELEHQELSDLWETEEKFCRILTDVEFRGILINLPLLRDYRDDAEKRMLQLEVELGCDPMKPAQLNKLLFEQHSFRPVGYTPGKPTKQFPNGRPMMDEKALMKMAKTCIDPVKSLTINKVLEYRGLVKAKGTWYEGFIQAADSISRLHPSFNQHGTTTTRLSCSDPNMQQLPRDVESTPVYKALEASPGYHLYSFDYSQLEFRLTAVYANESSILEGYRRGVDFHSLTARNLGVSRQLAKTVNFLIVYGGGAGKLSETAGIPLESAREVLSRFHAAYPNIAKIAAKAEFTADQRGFVKLWTGRRRHFVNKWEHHKAFNSIIQGGAHEIIKRSALNFYESDIRRRGLAHLVCEVHDAFWFEVSEEFTDEINEQIKDLMEWPSKDSEFMIDFPVDIKRLA